MAWFSARPEETQAGRGEQGRHRRGPVDQVRLVQGDRVPRRGRARRARLPEVPLCLPHLRPRAHRASWPIAGTLRGARDERSPAPIRSASRTPSGIAIGSGRPSRRPRASEAVVVRGGAHRRAARRALRLRVRLPGRQHGLGGRARSSRGRSSWRSTKHAAGDHRLRLGRRAHAGGHPLADADGQDLGRAGAARREPGCRSSRC